MNKTVTEVNPALQPVISHQRGHLITRLYKYTGSHIMVTIGTETHNVGFHADRQYLRQRNKYAPGGRT